MTPPLAMLARSMDHGAWPSLRTPSSSTVTWKVMGRSMRTAMTISSTARTIQMMEVVGVPNRNQMTAMVMSTMATTTEKMPTGSERRVVTRDSASAMHSASKHSMTSAGAAVGASWAAHCDAGRPGTGATERHHARQVYRSPRSMRMVQRRAPPPGRGDRTAATGLPSEFPTRQMERGTAGSSPPARG